MDKFKVFKFKDGFEYRFNRVLLLSTFILILGLLIFVLAKDKFAGDTKYYSYCPEKNKAGCFNAFYNSNLCRDGALDSNSSFCTIEHMFPGESIGTKPPWYIKYFSSIGFTLILITLLVNNFLYNKDFLKYCFKKNGSP